MTPTTEATAVLTFLLVLSLITSYVTFRFLKSSAMISRQGVRLGGAAAMFVITFCLLNRYLPQIRQGLVEEARADQPVKGSTPTGIADIGRVTVSPRDQMISDSDFRHIDRNTYYVDDVLRVAIRRPESPGWEAGLTDSIEVIGIQDVPFFGAGMTAFQDVLAPQAVKAFGVRAQVPHEVTIEGNSTIASVPVATNPFEDEDYVRRSLAAAQTMISGFGMPGVQQNIPEEILRKVQEDSVKQFKAKLALVLPRKRQIRNGVFVLPITKNDLKRSFISKFLPESSLLDLSLQYATWRGLLSQGSVHNLTVDQSRALASFNGSVRLGQVGIDGRVTDAVLNNIGFIVAGEERAILVALIYMSVDDVGVFRTLQGSLESLRFTA